jgi:hypothetical protein
LTRDENGNELGTFTPATEPTDTEANNLIQIAVDETYPVLGADIPDAPGADSDALRRAAKRLVALRAAAEVILSKVPEQVAAGRTPYQQYIDAYNDGLKRLSTAISEVESGDSPEAGGSMSASYDFPADAGGMVGWGTRW